MCRKMDASVVVMDKIINSKIQCEELLFLINFHLPRFYSKFAIDFKQSANVSLKSLIYVMSKIVTT